MWSWLTYRLPALPAFPTPVEQSQAPAVRRFLVTELLAALVWLTGVTLFIPASPALVITQAAALVIIIADLAACRLLQAGQFAVAVGLSALALVVATLLVLTFWDHASAQAVVPALMVSVVLTGLLGSRRSLLLTAVLCSSAMAVILLDLPQLLGAPRVAVPVPSALLTVSIFTLSTGVLVVLLLQFGQTLRRTLQASLLRQQELEQTRQALTAQTRELAQALEERRALETHLVAAQHMESLGILAGGIAHDFNNLLTIMLASTDMARSSLPADHGAQEDLHAVVQAATRARRLTRQLLGFARRQPMQLEVVDLNGLVQTLQPFLRHTIDVCHHLVIDLDPTILPVQADAGQLEQVVLNLVLNARDAMPDGGTLRIATRCGVAADADGGPAAERAAAMSLLVVEDTGAGMDAATCARIFEPFFTTKGRERGTGLGLAMCYGILTQHGGQISVSSAVGQGTQVQVAVPSVPRAAAVGASAIAAPLPATGAPAHGAMVVSDGLAVGAPPPRAASTVGVVLVVDDESAVRRVVGQMLAQQGYAVREAADGVAALQLVAASAETRIRLLITDVVMPQLRGPELATTLWEQQPMMPVIFMSGHTEGERLPTAPGGGASPFLAKPFTRGELVQAVRDLIGPA